MRLALFSTVAALAVTLTACDRAPRPADVPATASPSTPVAPAASPSPEVDPDRLAPSGTRKRAHGPARTAHAAHAGDASPLCENPGAGPEPDGALLRAFVGGRTKAIRDCYERALKRDANLHGRMVVRFTIGRCGEVSDLELAGRRRSAPDLDACVTRAVKAWRLPFRPSEPVEVEYPFNFTAG